MTLGLRTKRCDAALLDKEGEYIRCQGWARHEIIGEAARYNAKGDRSVDKTKTLNLCGTHKNKADRLGCVTIWSGYLTPENGWAVDSFETTDAPSPAPDRGEGE